MNPRFRVVALATAEAVERLREEERPIHAKCPKCGTGRRVPAKRIGKHIECGNCKYEFEVLAPTTVEQQYRYKMVQIPPNIEVSAGSSTRGKAASYLESIVNEYAVDGWEFYRVDTIGVVVPPGCLGGLLGMPTTHTNYYVVTFRRLA